VHPVRHEEVQTTEATDIVRIIKALN
jgi:hypothetical protein